jgi:hypothetical protein
MFDGVSDESERRVARWRLAKRVAWAIVVPLWILRGYTVFVHADEGLEDIIAILWLGSTGAALLATTIFERVSDRRSGEVDAP